MRKYACLFGALALLGSAAGLCLRVVEVNTLLDRRTMLMEVAPVSIILMVVMAAFLVGFILLAKKWPVPDFPPRYGPVFRGTGMLTVSVLCCLALLVGASLGLHRWKESGKVFHAILALLAALSGFGWLSLSFDAQRKKPDGCTLLAAAMPIVFCGLLLVGYYKTYAPIPAMRYTMYTFLALCADLLAVHFFAGFTAPRLRPRTALAFAGAGIVLSLTSLPGVEETEIRIYLAVFAVQLCAHSLRMLIPREYDAADFAEPVPPEAEAPNTGEAEQPEAESAEAPETVPEAADTDPEA